MSASEASTYEKFEITSADGEKTVDLSTSVSEFRLYEDIFSPIITASVDIISTGNVRIGNKGNYSNSLVSGLGIDKKESVKISIENKVKQRIDIDLLNNNLTNLISDNNRESFTLHLFSEEAFTNETSRVERKLKHPTVDTSVASIITEELKSDKIYLFDPSSTRIEWMGNNKKPFTVILNLASRTLSTKVGKSGGYVFYETRRGFNFKSIDTLVEQSPRAAYQDISAPVDPNHPQGVDVDKKILRSSFEKTSDLARELSHGTFSSKRFVWNPLNGSITETTIEFKPESYVGDISNLGKKKLSVEDDFYSQPSRYFASILDIGRSFEDTEIKFDPALVDAQTAMRYNSLFMQVINITVPSNLDLHAGDVILCDFPSISKSETDQERSGKYLIKELCHYFSQNESYTALRLVRDTYGRKTT